MRQLAVRIAVLGFFGLGLAGWLSGQEALTCTLRALIGAAVLFVLARVAGRAVVAIVADAAKGGHRNQARSGEESST